jgi:hypothetical protein
MKPIILVFAIVALAFPMHAADFSRKSTFHSIEAFIATAKTFQPSNSKSDLSSLFVIPEMGEDNHGQPIAARTVQSCATVWAGDDSALLLAVASPPTVGTRSCVGILFLLVRQDQWQIADLRRFSARGKYAEISAELTAATGTGYHLGTEGMAPVVTIKASHGGRGYAYQAYESYTFEASKLKPLELQ